MPLLNTKQTAERTQLSPATLAKYRVTGDGPAFRKLGRRVLYEESAVNEWIASHAERRSTSEQDASAR